MPTFRLRRFCQRAGSAFLPRRSRTGSMAVDALRDPPASEDKSSLLTKSPADALQTSCLAATTRRCGRLWPEGDSERLRRADVTGLNPVCCERPWAQGNKQRTLRTGLDAGDCGGSWSLDDEPNKTRRTLCTALDAGNCGGSWSQDDEQHTNDEPHAQPWGLGLGLDQSPRGGG